MLLLYLLFLLLPISTLTHKQKYSCRSNAPCGCSIQPAILAKIVGGETVRKRSWGWLVSLTQYSNHTHFCGGSILSSSWILTAAHCVSSLDASDITIHAGSNNLHHSSQKREVAEVFSHPDFDPYTYVNDIALIQLSSPLDMNDPDLTKICLPPKTVVDDDDSIDNSVSPSEYPPVHSTVVAIGWGQTAENIRSTSAELQQVTLHTIAYESNSCGLSISSKERQFCAGVEMGGKDTCQGDSGGPLMKFSLSKQWILAGITSFGYGCGRAEYSGIYTRVAFYSNWISAIISIDDLSNDPVLTAEETLDYNFPDELIANNCSHYHLSPLLFIVILICLSLYLFDIAFNELTMMRT